MDDILTWYILMWYTSIQYVVMDPTSAVDRIQFEYIWDCEKFVMSNICIICIRLLIAWGLYDQEGKYYIQYVWMCSIHLCGWLNNWMSCFIVYFMMIIDVIYMCDTFLGHLGQIFE